MHQLYVQPLGQHSALISLEGIKQAGTKFVQNNGNVSRLHTFGVDL